ncbi:MAG: ankyrin repeat domain-containing protein [Candidatus Eremiobacteraeota bacterium]|nr:ankyrin repeat domain-containing protein [Candidatus Eremiobacteraeota bacterium]
MKCSSCGTENEDTATSCHKCGCSFELKNNTFKELQGDKAQEPQGKDEDSEETPLTDPIHNPDEFPEDGDVKEETDELEGDFTSPIAREYLYTDRQSEQTFTTGIRRRALSFVCVMLIVMLVVVSAYIYCLSVLEVKIIKSSKITKSREVETGKPNETFGSATPTMKPEPAITPDLGKPLSPELLIYLKEAIRDNNPENVRKMLDEHPDLIDARDRDENTPLHHAVMSCNKQIVEILVYRSANVNIKNRKGKTPLIIAEERDSPEFREILNILRKQ